MSGPSNSEFSEIFWKRTWSDWKIWCTANRITSSSCPSHLLPIPGECHADTTTEFKKCIFYSLHHPNLLSLNHLLRDTLSAGSILGPCALFEGQSRSLYVYHRWVVRGEKTDNSAVPREQQLSGWNQAGCTQEEWEHLLWANQHALHVPQPLVESLLPATPAGAYLALIITSLGMHLYNPWN